MTLKRYELTPQMRDYDAFNDSGQRRYVPYLMYFHRPNFTSETINTDRCGFRISTGPGGIKTSAAGDIPAGPVRLLVGGSTAFGIGATSDSSTLASMLWSRYAPSAPWLNFAGWSFSPTQEVLLFTLYRHLLENISEIVILSGINAIMLARLPEWQQGDHGAFFFCGEYFQKMEELRKGGRKNSKFSLRRAKPAVGIVPTFDATIATFDDVRRDIPMVINSAANMTLRQLDVWRRLAGPDTRISFVLQPMARWIRQTPAPQEKLLYDEYDDDRFSELGGWEAVHGDVATTEVSHAFATALREGCEKHGVRFFDLNPVVAEVIAPQDWLFVDRIHYNDTGSDIVARIMAEALELL